MRTKVASFIKKWRTEFALFTVICYLMAIPFTFYVFPDNNVWIALLIVFAGLTDSLNSLADRMDDEEMESEGGLTYCPDCGRMFRDEHTCPEGE